MTTEQSRDRDSAPFDQTNGVVAGLDGDSDGTAASDTASEASRKNDAPMPLKRVGAARDFGLHIKPTDAAGNSAE